MDWFYSAWRVPIERLIYTIVVDKASTVRLVPDNNDN